MNNNPFYVYALKDPRKIPAEIFYIGKGTGNRMENHLDELSESEKVKVINEIKKSGNVVLVEKIVDNLTENDAYKIEAELISAFGIRSRGGKLTNSVRPSGKVRKLIGLNVPDGCYEKAQCGVSFLESSILEFIKSNPSGVTNGDVSKYLGLQSDYLGGSINYLSYSILGILLRNNKITKDGRLHKYIDEMSANKLMHRSGLRPPGDL